MAFAGVGDTQKQRCRNWTVFGWPVRWLVIGRIDLFLCASKAFIVKNICLVYILGLTFVLGNFRGKGMGMTLKTVGLLLWADMSLGWADHVFKVF